MPIIGYARTSTSDQIAGLEGQERDLKAAGCALVFAEHVSSVAAARAGLTATMAKLQCGDTLMVTKPDRLARSTQDLLKIVEDLQQRGCALVILSMGGERLDTRNPTTKLILTILGGVATWEREIMLERQREGIARGRAAGRYKGRAARPQSLTDSVLQMVAKNISPEQICADLTISRSTYFRTKRGRTINETGGVPPVLADCAD